MKEQLTAVEWFNQQLVDRQNGNGDSRSRDEIFEQALAMEKEQRGYSEEDVMKALLIKHDGLSVNYVMQIVKSTKSE